MNKWIKKKFKSFLITILTLAVLYISIISAVSINNTYKAATEMTWQQSVERELQQQNESYQEDIYERYAKAERVLTSYQSITNKRMDSLEERVGDLENHIKDLENRVEALQQSLCLPNIQSKEEE